MPRRAATVIGLLFIAFATVGADGCDEALDDWSPPPTSDATTEPVRPSGDGWYWDGQGWRYQAPGSAAATSDPPASSDQAFSVETPGPSSSDAPAPTTQEPKAVPTPDFSGETVTLFSNSNSGGIRDGASGPATLVIDEPTLVTYVQTYHWHGGRGVKPGTISITGPDGTVHGPWQAIGTDGQGGVKNAYWEAGPMVELAPGTYLVDDSDPATRGTNDEMGGIGQTIVRGIVAAP